MRHVAIARRAKVSESARNSFSIRFESTLELTHEGSSEARERHDGGRRAFAEPRFVADPVIALAVMEKPSGKRP